MMNGKAIIVDGIAKLYRLGLRQRVNENFREAVVSAMKAPLRRLRRLGSRIDADEELWALREVSFEVAPGEVVGVIGRNGAGKSTLLKVLSRITPPTAGRALIAGRVGSLLEVGTGFHPELTGRENIYLNGAILGMTRSEIRRKFDQIVAFAEMEKFLDTPVKRYSSGMYVRLAFAVAAHLEPEILLVDEVLAVGDAEFQKKCLGKMKEVSTTGRTVLFVSHNMNAVQRLCGKVVLLEGGRLRAFSDDVPGVVRQYLFGDGDQQCCQWVNPGEQFANRYFTPRRFFISDAQGRPLAMPVTAVTDAYVRIEGDVADFSRALSVGYAIYGEDGNLLYWTFHTDGPEESWPVLAPGRCAIAGKLPRRLLNEGTYRIELISRLHFTRWLTEPTVNAPSIFVTVSGGLSDSPLFMQKRVGLLAPIIEWRQA